MSIRIKFCGVREPEDAAAAVAAGADLVGLNFVPESPRCIDVAAAAEIAHALEGRAERVALFQNASATQVEKVLRRVSVERIQFHGEESPDFVGSFGMPTIKALVGADRSEAERYPDSVILVDHPSGAAGAGESWDWSQARRLVEAGFQVLLAGGLSPENVASALAGFDRHGPWGVDVASGIETHGRKDPRRMAAFVETVRKTEQVP
jgi:phosphoribosylanthranilate isomerase